MTNVIQGTFQQVFNRRLPHKYLDEIIVMFVTRSPGWGSFTFMDDVACSTLAFHGWRAPSIEELSFRITGPVIEEIPFMILDLIGNYLQMALANGIIRVTIGNELAGSILDADVPGFP